MKLIVMLIALGVHYGPTTIAGFDTLAACEASRSKVVAFYKKTTRSNEVITECVALPSDR
jgi:hypothetical protein